MANRFAEIAFTSSVRAAQSEYGTGQIAGQLRDHDTSSDELGEREMEFIGRRDTFFLATVGETGWPYVQHRGGPEGFVKVIDSGFLAFADFKGNGQLISTGNASVNQRCAMIFIDYVNRRRLKVFGFLQLQHVELAPAVVRDAIQLPDYRARIERAAMIHVAAFDWNCPQHIARRFTEKECLNLRPR